jgi:hypothetical protein
MDLVEHGIEGMMSVVRGSEVVRGTPGVAAEKAP